MASEEGDEDFDERTEGKSHYRPLSIEVNCKILNNIVVFILHILYTDVENICEYKVFRRFQRFSLRPLILFNSSRLM